MECCQRCGDEFDELVELHRFGDVGVTSEAVCSGCCTRIELVIARRITEDPDLQAFVLAMSDGLDQLIINRKLSKT